MLSLSLALATLALLTSHHRCLAQQQDEQIHFPPQEARITSQISVGSSNPGEQVAPPLEAEQRKYQTSVGNFNLDVQNQPYRLGYDYHNYDQMTAFLRSTTSKYPSLTALYSIGKSVQGECMFVCKFSLKRTA